MIDIDALASCHDDDLQIQKLMYSLQVSANEEDNLLFAFVW